MLAVKFSMLATVPIASQNILSGQDSGQWPGSKPLATKSSKYEAVRRGVGVIVGPTVTVGVGNEPPYKSYNLRHRCIVGASIFLFGFMTPDICKFGNVF